MSDDDYITITLSVERSRWVQWKVMKSHGPINAGDVVNHCLDLVIMQEAFNMGVDTDAFDDFLKDEMMVEDGTDHRDDDRGVP